MTKYVYLWTQIKYQNFLSIFMQYFCYNFDNWYRFYSFDFQKLVSMAIRVSNLGIYKISTFPLFSLSKITLKEWI